MSKFSICSLGLSLTQIAFTNYKNRRWTWTAGHNGQQYVGAGTYQWVRDHSADGYALPHAPRASAPPSSNGYRPLLPESIYLQSYY